MGYADDKFGHYVIKNKKIISEMGCIEGMQNKKLTIIGAEFI